MTQQRKCDTCGATPAQRVEVGVTLFGVVVPDAPTGFSEGADTCSAHQTETVDALFAHAKMTLEEQVPFVRQMVEHASARDELQADLNTLRPMLAMLDGVPEDKWTTDARATKASATDLSTKIADAEAKRIKVFTDAKAAHDERTASFRKALKKKT